MDLHGLNAEELDFGWHPGGLIVPPYQHRLEQGKFALAILDTDGSVIPGSNCNLQRKTNIGFCPDTSTFTNDLVKRTGRWLFGGFFQPHFGHQITQCLGRLPWRDVAGEIDGIVFAGQPKAARQSRRQHHFKELMQLFAPDVPVELAIQPTQFEHLFVGQSLFGEITSGIPNKNFVDWVHMQLAPLRDKTIPGTKLYVSRSTLHPSLGRILCEEVLESNLTKAGFEIFHPQMHPLADQLEKYFQAETIILTDGSAAHMLAFSQNSNQTVIVISRRLQKPVFIHNHLLGFQANPDESSLQFLDCLMQEWYSPGNAKIRPRGELDFAGLAAKLVELNILSQSDLSHWTNPDPVALEISKAVGTTKSEPMAILP